MYYVGTQGVDERVINVHYYYDERRTLHVWSSCSCHVLDMNAKWRRNPMTSQRKYITRVVIPPFPGGGGALPTAREGFLTRVVTQLFQCSGQEC